MSMVFKGLKTDEKHEIVIGTIRAEFTTPDGEPAAGYEYVLELSDGSTRQGTLSKDGKLEESNVPPDATAKVRLVGVPMLAKAE